MAVFAVYTYVPRIAQRVNRPTAPGGPSSGLLRNSVTRSNANSRGWKEPPAAPPPLVHTAECHQANDCQYVYTDRFLHNLHDWLQHGPNHLESIPQSRKPRCEMTYCSR